MSKQPGLDAPQDYSANPIVSAFGTRLHAWRKTNDLTLKEVAQSLGLSISIICEWENLRRFPSPEHLLQVAQLMKVSPGVLVTPPKTKARTCPLCGQRRA
jgi:transcriptional regulator with XRE-family HTH domain